MAVEHKDIPDSGLHEPKGVVSAASGQVYVADGVGSGSWGSPSLSGQSLASAGESPVSDGGGGVTWEEANPGVNYGVIVAANLSQVVALPGGSLYTSANYRDLTQYFTVRGVGGDVTTDAGKKFVVGSTGTYRVTAWVSASSSSGTATVAWDVGINGVFAGVGSPIVISKAKSTGDIQVLPGFGIQDFTAGDVISIGAAADASIDFTLREGVMDIIKLS